MKLIREWQEFIKKGNEHFQQEAFELAEDAYTQACEHAVKIFHHSVAVDQSINAVLTSYYSLANSLQRQGCYQAALEVLKKLHQLVHQSLESASSNSAHYDHLIKAHFDTYRELARVRNSVAYEQVDFEAFYPTTGENIPRRQRNLN